MRGERGDMRLKTLVPLVAAIVMTIGTAQAATAVSCGDDGGRERLTSSGFAASFEAPAVTAPELATTHAETGDLVTPHRTARFPFVVDLGQFARGTITASITWELPSDYDLYVIGADGDVIARSDRQLGDDQEGNEEALEGFVQHCDRLEVVVRNWAGAPAQQIDLAVSVAGSGTLLACTESDPAPGCAGKAAGDAPDLIPDARSRFYLAGDAGQIAMAGPYQETLTQEKIPFNGVMSSQRPTSGIPNQHSRAAIGFRGQVRNPFFAHFGLKLDEPLKMVGAPSALVWVSMPGADATTKLIADLWSDDYLIASVEIVGGELVGARDPIPVSLTFPHVDWTAYDSLTLQIGMDAVATSDAAIGNPADAQMTLWYGSVQFQSRLTLPA